MIRDWFIMKKKEIALKLTLYTVIETIITEQRDIITLLSGLYSSLKDVPYDQLKDEFLGKLAEIIHDQAESERNTDNM